MQGIPTKEKRRAVEFETYEEANETYYALARCKEGYPGKNYDTETTELVNRLMGVISDICSDMIREGKP